MHGGGGVFGWRLRFDNQSKVKIGNVCLLLCRTDHYVLEDYVFLYEVIPVRLVFRNEA